MWASRLARKMRQEGARRMHHAPEIDVHQPVHLRLVDFVELAEQGHAGIVDEDVEAGMGCDRGLREILDLAGFADIDAVHGDFSRMGFGDLGGHRLQPRLVAIRQREVGAARRKLKRQRPADTTGGAGHGGGGSTDCGHRCSSTRGWGNWQRLRDCRVSRPLRPTHIRLTGFGNGGRLPRPARLASAEG